LKRPKLRGQFLRRRSLKKNQRRRREGPEGVALKDKSGKNPAQEGAGVDPRNVNREPLGVKNSSRFPSARRTLPGGERGTLPGGGRKPKGLFGGRERSSSKRRSANAKRQKSGKSRRRKKGGGKKNLRLGKRERRDGCAGSPQGTKRNACS